MGYIRCDILRPERLEPSGERKLPWLSWDRSPHGQVQLRYLRMDAHSFGKGAASTPATIAMLCKTGAARKVLRFAWQNDGRIAAAWLTLLTRRGTSARRLTRACWWRRPASLEPAEVDVFDSLSATERAEDFLGLAGQDLVFDHPQAYRRLKHLEGLCPYQWRSGVKHDCASVMELPQSPGGCSSNKLGEDVGIEPDYLFPLLKCSTSPTDALKRSGSSL